VEAVLEGEIENIEKVAIWCRTGPRGAYVSEVNVKTEDYTGSFSTFSISFDRW
jgi:acylphosphatase